jgi:hypothetical protein
MPNEILDKDSFLTQLDQIVLEWKSKIPTETRDSGIFAGAANGLEGITYGDELQNMHMILLELKGSLPQYFDNFRRLDEPGNEIKPEDFEVYISPETYLEQLEATVENISKNIAAIRDQPVKAVAAAKSAEIANYLPGFKEMNTTVNSRIVEMQRFIDLEYESPSGDPIDTDPGYKLRKFFGAPIAWAAVNPNKAKAIGKATAWTITALAVLTMGFFGIRGISANISENQAIRATQQAQSFSATATMDAQIAYAQATQTSLEAGRRSQIAQYIATLSNAEAVALDARVNNGIWFTDLELNQIVRNPQTLIDQYISQGIGDPANIEAAITSAADALNAMSNDLNYQMAKSYQFFFVSAHSTGADTGGSTPNDAWLNGIVCGGFGDPMGTFGEGNYADDRGIVIISKGNRDGLTALAEVERELRDGQIDSTIVLRNDGNYVLGLAPNNRSSQITQWYYLGNHDITNISGDDLVKLIEQNQCPDGGQ